MFPPRTAFLVIEVRIAAITSARVFSSPATYRQATSRFCSSSPGTRVISRATVPGPAPSREASQL